MNSCASEKEDERDYPEVLALDKTMFDEWNLKP